MKQCPICQTSNDAQALFCAECGHRFAAQAQAQPPAQPQPNPGSAQLPQSAAPSQAPQVPQEQAPKPKPKKVKLHSPILGDSEPIEDEPDFGRKQKNQSRHSKPAKKSLRSPLLGADDDDESFEEFPRRSPGSKKSSELPGKPKSKLRSPLLGDDDDDDMEMDSYSSQSNFPKRSSKKSQSNTGGPTSLRSPLLGGDDSSFEDPYDDEYDDSDDPTALRSPLLRARSHAHEHKKQSNTKPNPPQELAAAPPQPQPQPQPAPSPQPTMGQAQQPPNPVQVRPPVQPQPVPTPGQPPMPGSMPPGPVPGVQSVANHPGVGQQSSPQQIQNAQVQPNSNQYTDPNAVLSHNVPPLPMPSAPVQPAPKTAPVDTQGKSTVRKTDDSNLDEPIKKDSQHGPTDRRGKDRRGPRERRSFSSLVDDSASSGDSEFQHQAQASGISAGIFAVTMLAAIIGVLSKTCYLFVTVQNAGFQNNELFVFDQVGSIVVYIGLIIFAFGAKKS